MEIKKLLEDIPLKTRLEVITEMAFIDLISELGYRKDKMWTDEEDKLLSKLCKLALKHTENILEEIEEVDSNKLKIAKEALEFYESYSKDPAGDGNPHRNRRHAPRPGPAASDRGPGAGTRRRGARPTAGDRPLADAAATRTWRPPATR